MQNKNRAITRLKNSPFIVWGLLAIQIGVFLLMTLAGLQIGVGLNGSNESSILVRYGAMYKPLVVYGREYWRFITPMFVHIGFWHLLINSITLYFTGIELEKILGHWRFFWVYLLSGIAGNVLSFGFGAPNSISAGASTAIFGLFGLYVALGRNYPSNPMVRYMGQNMLTLIVMNLLMNLFSSGIDMLGHIGGVLGGLLLGFMIRVPSLEDYRFINSGPSPRRRVTSLLLFIFILGVSVAYGYKRMAGGFY